MKVYVVVEVVKSRESTEILSVDVDRVFDNIEKAKANILDRLSNYDEVAVGSLGYYYGNFNGSTAETMYSIREIEVL